MRSFKDVGDYLAYLVVRVLICVVQGMRIETCAVVARWLAVLANDVIRLRGRVIEENLRLAFPELSENERRRLARRMWEHLFLMVIEIAHAPRKIHDTTWRRYIRFTNQREMMRTLFVDRPKVAVSGHFGNFELAGYTFGLFGFDTYAVARPLDNRFLDRFVRTFRSARGQHILAKNGSAGEIAELLERRRTLSVLADQNAGPKGCWVNFFGRPASTHKAIALFSLSNDAPIMVGFARRLGEPLHFEMGTEFIADPRNLAPAERGVKELTQWFTNCLEQVIRRAPEQYWWVHRRWKDSPPTRGRKQAA
ncbi:MAG TPA: lysophospholipid acyltransferase family protein [Pirellulales bacterium]|nr:lysophospholipid acyltransferase family protein [Pirellulales bacterium]